MKCKVYRDGGGPIEDRIKAAMTDLYKRHGALPVQIIVNPIELEQAQAACKALAVKVPVDVTGGCLVPEVWLELPEKGGD